MTTLTEIENLKTEITAAERVEKILTRLDSGELLIGGRLRENSNFCILGLFADESGLGRWQPSNHNGLMYDYIMYDKKLVAELNEPIVQLFNLHDNTGRFRLSAVSPPKVKSFLINEVFERYPNAEYSSLMNVNDRMTDYGYRSKDINDTLAAIIRSGAVFKQDTKE